MQVAEREITTRADIIAENVLAGFSQFGKEFGLIMLGSSVYGDERKRDNPQDADFIVVINNWSDLAEVFNQEFFAACGITVENLQCKDFEILAEHPELLLRISGIHTAFKIKSTLNFVTNTKLKQVYSAFPHNFRKISHGKAVPIKEVKSFQGEQVLLERVCDEITHKYDHPFSAGRDFVQGDKNYYLTADGVPLLGILADAFLTGKILTNNAELDPMQEKLKEQYIRALYYCWVVSAQEDEFENIAERFIGGTFNYLLGLMREDRFSPEYRQMLLQDFAEIARTKLTHITPQRIRHSRPVAISRMIKKTVHGNDRHSDIHTYAFEPLRTKNPTEIVTTNLEFLTNYQNLSNEQLAKRLNALLTDIGHYFRVLSYEKLSDATSVNSYIAKILGNDGNYYFLKIPKNKDLSLISEVKNERTISQYMSVEVAKLIVLANDCEMGFFSWIDSNTFNKLLTSTTATDDEVTQVVKARNKEIFNLFVGTAKRVSNSEHSQAQIHMLYHRRLLSRPKQWYENRFTSVEGKITPFAALAQKEILLNGVSLGTVDTAHENAVEILNPYNHLQTVVSLGLGDMHGNNTFVNNGKLASFDFGNCAYHWSWLDLAKDLHINTYLDLLLGVDVLPHGSIKYQVNSNSIELVANGLLPERKRKYWQTQMALLQQIVAAISSRRLYPYDWHKIFSGALYTNFLFTRDLSKGSPEIALLSLANACFFGKLIEEPEETFMHEIEKWIQDV